MGDIHDYYRRIESERAGQPRDPRLRQRQYAALTGAATFFTFLGYVTAVLGTIGTIVFVNAVDLAPAALAFSIVLFSLLTVALYTVIMLAAGGIIRLLIGILENTSGMTRATGTLARLMSQR